MTRIILAAALWLALGAPAFAFQCPSDIAAIDAELAKGPDLSAEELAEIQQLRDQGQQLHEAGQHDEAVETLAEAKALLGMEM